MLRYVWLADLAVNASRFEPGSIPTTMFCVLRDEGSTFKRTQNTPFLQNGVALPLSIHRAALEGVVGISGL